MLATTATLVLCLTVLAGGQSTYTSKYDNINLEEIFQNERLLQNYVKCLLNKGPCTPDAAELRRIIPEVLQNNCAKCSPVHSERLDKALTFVINKKPDVWKQLAEFYDPDGVYAKKYSARLNKPEDGSSKKP